jgi:bacteriocin leader peptide (microcyclamide/patellamide family)
MDKQNLMPQAAQPVNRIITGQLPESLADLSEEALQLHGGESSASVLAFGASEREFGVFNLFSCSYDGDDAE